MHDALRQRLMRKIESLPEQQIYQVLDYIEFLESKYTSDIAEEVSTLQRFAESVEDKLRKRAMSPATLREAFQVISVADRVLSNVSTAGRQLIEELAPSLGERPADKGSNEAGEEADNDPDGPPREEG